jgi:hypothetical protein
MSTATRFGILAIAFAVYAVADIVHDIGVRRRVAALERRLAAVEANALEAGNALLMLQAQAHPELYVPRWTTTNTIGTNFDARAKP